MPGMMDTISISDERRVVEIVAKQTKNARSPGIRIADFYKCMATSSWAYRSGPRRSRAVRERHRTLEDQRYGKHDFPDVKLSVADLKEW